MARIDQLFHVLKEREALTQPGGRPRARLRVHGPLEPVGGEWGMLTHEELIDSCARWSKPRPEHLQSTDFDFATAAWLPASAPILRQENCRAVFRIIPRRLHHLEELRLPKGSRDRPSPPRLVLVTGPTGSGKSTTLAAIIGRSTPHRRHIVTIEDPSSSWNKLSVPAARGRHDTESFAAAAPPSARTPTSSW